MIKIVLVNNEGKTLLANDSNIPMSTLSKVENAEFFPGGGFNGRASAYLHIRLGKNPQQSSLPAYRNVVLPDDFDPAVVAGIRLEDTNDQVKPVQFLPRANNPLLWEAQHPEMAIVNAAPHVQTGVYQSQQSKLSVQIEQSILQKFDWAKKVGVTLMGSVAYCEVHAHSDDFNEDNEKLVNDHLLDVQDMLDRETGKSWAVNAELKKLPTLGQPISKKHDTFSGKLEMIDNPEHVTPGQQPVTTAGVREGMTADTLAAQAPFTESREEGDQGVPLGSNFQTYGASGQGGPERK
jgi:hypothetical protein